MFYEGSQSRYTELQVGNEVDSMMGKPANSELDKFCSKFSQASSKISPEVRKASPAAKIIATAKDMKADLIVIASQGRNPLARVFFYDVSRKALCSVFVIPH